MAGNPLPARKRVCRHGWLSPGNPKGKHGGIGFAVCVQGIVPRRFPASPRHRHASQTHYLQDVDLTGSNGISLDGNSPGGEMLVHSPRILSYPWNVGLNIFWHWYGDLGSDGCSSHSGRRTFITNAARKISTVGGSMRYARMLARHTSLNMTMRYVEADKDAMRKVVELV